MLISIDSCRDNSEETAKGPSSIAITTLVSGECTTGMVRSSVAVTK